jgi:outer membrane lipase/esterase
MKFSKLLASTVAVVGLAVASHANATAVYFFGDSLTDTGNKTAGIPFPYAPGQVTDAFGNGVWANTFAAAFGANAVSSATRGGTNFAEAGARTYSYTDTNATTGAITSYNGVGAQVDLFQAAFPTRDPNRASDIFVIMIGGNDIQPGLADRVGTIASGIANIRGAVLDLYNNSGARHFLIADMPAASSTPRVRSFGSAVRSAFSSYESDWNVSFARMIAGLNGSLGGIDVDVLNLSAIAGYNDAQLTALGFNPLLQEKACFDVQASPPVITGVATRCAGYLYSDPFHPSSAGHRVIADLALRAVPLPGSVALLGLGLLALFGSRRFIRK